MGWASRARKATWHGATTVTLNATTSDESSTILLTGATGYIGGRLLRMLEQQGYRVRCLARRPEAVRRTAPASTEVVAGDVIDRPSLDSAPRGHTRSMTSTGGPGPSTYGS